MATIITLRKVTREEISGAYNKVMQWFFAYPNAEMSLSDISERLRIAKTTANRIIGLLVKEGFLLKKVAGKTWRLSCNQQHPYNVTRKIAYNLLLIYESRILEAVHEQIESPRAIVLFGSYRKGDDTEESDIDIAVEVLDSRELRIYTLGSIPQLGYRKSVKVNLHVFSRNKIDLNLFSNIANGIALQGFLEARP